MREFADLSNELERVYEVVIRGRLDEIEAMSNQYSLGQRSREPRALALRAMCSVLGGDVPGGIGLLERAVARSDARTRPYLSDLLVPLLLTGGDFDRGEAMLHAAGEVEPMLEPAFNALRAVIAARRGQAGLSRRIADEAVEQARENDHSTITVRVLQRSSLAAFYREDFAQAQERGLEAARACERLGLFRNAAIAYSVPYVIAHVWSGDADSARFYAQRVTMNGRRANDLAWQNYGLVSQLEIAAEAGDHRRFGSIRARLMANPLHEQYRERFSMVLAEALAAGWAGRFDAVRTVLTSLRAVEPRTLSERSLCNALLALVAAATGQFGDSRRLARLAISQTAVHAGRDSSCDVQRRRMARIVAVATCLIVGDTIRGQRALSSEFDPTTTLLRFVTRQGVDEGQVPAMMRGYARLINVAAKSAAAIRPAAGLTSAELVVLRTLPDGMTLAAIAADLRKSPETVKKQVQSVYAKLGVKNRVQAIRRAQDLRIF